MSLPVRIREEAEADLADAAAWYENQWPGLGDAFLAEIEAAPERLANNPQQYPVVHRQTRRALIHRFPFGIFFRTLEGEVVVIAVMHARRSPRQWKTRG